MTAADWLAIPPTPLPVTEVIPTQGCLVIDRLVDLTGGAARHGGDRWGHAVAFGGRTYIHDGHHDWAIRWLRGDPQVPLRVVPLDTACVDPCCKDC
jgi:hypothetical protein